MKKVDVKRNLELSPLAFGCEQLGGTDWGEVNFALARESVRCALDHGVSVFDTADVYGLGRSEKELAKALGGDRHRVTIVTKGGIRWGKTDTTGRAKTFHDASPGYLMTAIEASLKRLCLDTIPVYLVHWPDPLTPVEETLELLAQARIEGKICSYGLSNFNFDLVRPLVSNYDISYLEGSYSLLDRLPVEKNYEEARHLGLKTLTYGPLAQGLLTGKYTDKSIFEVSDRRHRLPQFASERWVRNIKLLRTIGTIAQRHGKTLAQTAIRWVLDSGVASSVIVGAKNPFQVESNIGALGWSLQPEEWEELVQVADGDILNSIED